MTDLAHDDATFEQDLRAMLADLAPGAAPASLHVTVAAVPGRPERRAPGRGRALLAVMGLAAVVVVAVAGIGLLTGPRPIQPAGMFPTDGAPTAVPSPSPGMALMAFRVLMPDGSKATKAQVDAVATMMEARLAAYGIGTFGSSASDDILTYDMQLPQADPRSVASVRDLLSAPGAISIVLVGATPINPGERVSGPPIVTGDAFTDARVGSDQVGRPTLDLSIDVRTAATFADETRTHVGDYLAIALDGVAVAVPVINEAIPDGRLQISFATDDTTPARLAAIVQAGLAVSRPGLDRAKLPLPVEVVTP